MYVLTGFGLQLGRDGDADLEHTADVGYTCSVEASPETGILIESTAELKNRRETEAPSSNVNLKLIEVRLRA